MRKSYLAIYFVSIVLTVNSGSYLYAHTNVTPLTAKGMLASNDRMIVIDVREIDSEYCAAGGHIPGALNYPWRSGILKARYDEIPMDSRILVVCQSGTRSEQAARFLDDKGYLYVYDMTGGMWAWAWETVGCMDSDEDGINDDLDNCPYESNPGQEDSDGDGTGDDCEDTDYDNDGLEYIVELNKKTDPYDRDTDGDGLNDGQDAHPLDPDADKDGIIDHLG